MRQRWIFLAVLIVAFTWHIDAQQIMALSGPIPPASVGLPPQPPFLTLLEMATPGMLATDPSIRPKGRAVQEVFYEELRGVASPAGPAGEVEASVRTKYDDQGRVVERIENRWNRNSDSLYKYENGRLVSVETSFPDAQRAEPIAWNYWAYDSRGKLTEYRRGKGAEIQNHETAFRYDNQGRLLGFEYRQGAEDKPFRRTEFSYSSDSKAVVVTEALIGTKIVDRSTRTLDDEGRVVRVVLNSEGRTANSQAHTILFRYDKGGRVVEQTTDAAKFSDSGAEQDLLPGTILIAYDDNAHTKTTKYSNPDEGNLETVVMQNEAGATTGFTLKAPSEQTTSLLECEFNRFGDWTSCRQIVEAGGQKVIRQGFRRTITYK